MGYCARMARQQFAAKTEYTGRIIAKIKRYAYTAELDDDGNIIGLNFKGNKLALNEDDMFQAIAPYIESGSFIEMHGDDNAKWRWIFENGKVKKTYATVVWP
ncbi:hypothetical protein DS742_17405 [Lacrimispora amygdalina]|uniref:Uncharacterized protein n=1 Tax=Lacrimispora amygdalina TaxID=253257 RepID=A0A3E2N9D2_9FIRM|nr:hypothetical protein [Clostridium indicum]RFZ77592.1 hypothetical protein DS742_17405 [Clostridium indicum]